MKRRPKSQPIKITLPPLDPLPPEPKAPTTSPEFVERGLPFRNPLLGPITTLDACSVCPDFSIKGVFVWGSRKSIDNVQEGHYLFRDQGQVIEFTAVPNQAGECFPPGKPTWATTPHGIFEGAAAGTTVRWRQTGQASLEPNDVRITATCAPYSAQFKMTVCVVDDDNPHIMGIEQVTGRDPASGPPDFQIPFAPPGLDLQDLTELLNGDWRINIEELGLFAPFQLSFRHHVSPWFLIGQQGLVDPPGIESSSYRHEGGALFLHVDSGEEPADVNVVTEFDPDLLAGHQMRPTWRTAASTTGQADPPTHPVARVRVAVMGALITKPFYDLRVNRPPANNFAVAFVKKANAGAYNGKHFFWVWQGIQKECSRSSDFYTMGFEGQAFPPIIPDFPDELVQKWLIQAHLGTFEVTDGMPPYRENGWNVIWATNPTHSPPDILPGDPGRDDVLLGILRLELWLKTPPSFEDFLGADERLIYVYRGHLARNTEDYWKDTAWTDPNKLIKLSQPVQIKDEDQTIHDVGWDDGGLACGESTLHAIIGTDGAAGLAGFDESYFTWLQTNRGYTPSLHMTLVDFEGRQWKRGTIVRLYTGVGPDFAHLTPRHWSTVISPNGATGDGTYGRFAQTWAGDAGTGDRSRPQLGGFYRVEPVRKYFDRRLKQIEPNKKRWWVRTASPPADYEP